MQFFYDRRRQQWQNIYYMYESTSNTLIHLYKSYLYLYIFTTKQQQHQTKQKCWCVTRFIIVSPVFECLVDIFVCCANENDYIFSNCWQFTQSHPLNSFVHTYWPGCSFAFFAWMYTVHETIKRTLNLVSSCICKTFTSLLDKNYVIATIRLKRCQKKILTTHIFERFSFFCACVDTLFLFSFLYFEKTKRDFKMNIDWYSTTRVIFVYCLFCFTFFSFNNNDDDNNNITHGEMVRCVKCDVVSFSFFFN